jgi:hypothetical protein
VTLADRPPEPPAARRLPLLAILLLVALAAAGGLAVLLQRPQLVFTNRLAGFVRLTVGDATPRTVAPGASVRVPGARGSTLVATWELVRPLSADSAPMGEDVRGSIVLRAPRGTMRAEATSRPAETAYFAPLITNATTHPLRVLVNAGLQSAVDCGCAVRPGGRRVFIGYYRLFQNSTVQARGPGTGAATFRDLGPRVTGAAGSVGLRFEDKDLRER